MVTYRVKKFINSCSVKMCTASTISRIFNIVSISRTIKSRCGVVTVKKSPGCPYLIDHSCRYWHNIFIIILICQICLVWSQKDDYYNLLGVARDANVKEIRKAFKKLAVKLHPDKNKNDTNADANFIKLAHAYEVLKDPESRKQYDLYGDDTDTSKFKKSYHSYSYYKDQFGIYDDDPLIVTLSKSDYEVNILDSNQAWIVNFYSPHCHHCHELASTWRKLAEELDGVIRIAAVNCEEDFSLCHHLRIEAYPTLLYYEKEAPLHEGYKFTGSRTLEDLTEFVLSNVKVNIQELSLSNWENISQEKWLLFLCAENDMCPEKSTIKKLAASLEGLISIGLVTDTDLCKKLSDDYHTNSIILLQKKNEETPTVVNVIQGSDTKEILENILEMLPNPETLDEQQFREIRKSLRDEAEKPWLLCFYIGTATNLNLQLKRLPAFMSDINIGLIHCGKSAGLCNTLHVVRYPTWGVLKKGGAFELHHGRDVLHEIVTFAKDSVKSINLHALSPADFQNLMQGGKPWFIDWYAPWCPPCRKLLPELRKASQHFTSEQVQFGTIDCTSHRELCSRNNVMSYPTTILYNNSHSNIFHGVRDAAGITEFIQDMLQPQVINLDEGNFIQLLRKPATEMWLVDYFASWCGPCQKLAIHWRRLAKQLAQFPEIKVAHVDCVANNILCDAQNVRSYPTVRLYPLGSKGLNSIALYSGNLDSVSLQRWVLSFLPSPVQQLTGKEFKGKILNKVSNVPWLVDFYAPWCGHCIHFEPEFRITAQKLEGVVKTSKVDCEQERLFCGEQGITGYPTVRLYLSPNKYFRIGSQESSEIAETVKKIIQNNKLTEHDEL